MSTNYPTGDDDTLISPVLDEALKTRSRRPSIASAASIVMAGFVLSRVLGLARVSIQASVLAGSGRDATAFTTAITIPDTVFTIVSGGALASSFIPVFAGMLDRGDDERAWRVASGVMMSVLAALLVGVGVAEILAPSIVSVMTKPGDAPLTLTLTRIMLLQPLFLALSALIAGMYNSYHRFVVPALAPLVYNLANITGLLLVPVFHNSVALAAWGVTLGALLQVVVMAPGLHLTRRLKAPFRALGEAGTREVGRLMVPRIIGQAGIQLTFVVTITLANTSFIDDPSPVLRYAGNLVALPIGIFGSALATAAFPTMTGQAARGELSDLGETVSRTLRSILFLALPSAVALLVLRYPIIAVLYGHYKFSAHDIDLTASTLVLYALGIPALAAVELLPRAFFALKDTWTPVLLNLVTLGAAVVLSVVAVRAAGPHDSSLGVALLAGVISLTVLAEVLWLGLVLRRRLHTLGLRELGLSTLRSFVAAEAMAAALLALLFLWKRFGPGANKESLLLLVIAVPLGVAVYGGWSFFFGAPEAQATLALLRRRLRRR